MIKMRTFMSLFLCLMMGVCLWAYVRIGKGAQQTVVGATPQQALSEYCQLAEQGSFERLNTYTTRVPQQYWDYGLRRIKEVAQHDPTLSANQEQQSKIALPPATIANCCAELFLAQVNKDFPS